MTAALVGIGCYLLVALTLNKIAQRMDPYPKVAVLTQKLDYLLEHINDFDVVFLGSSRIYRHIDPTVLDPELARLGCPVRTFNMGVPALNVIEQEYLLRRLREHPSSRMKWLFIDSLPATRGALENLNSERNRYFLQTFRDLRVAIEDNIQFPKRETAKYGASARVLYTWLYNQVSFGQLGQVLFGDPKPEDYTDGYTIRFDRAGFVPRDDEVNPTAGEADLVANADFLTTTLATLNRSTEAELAGSVTDGRLEFLRAQLDSAREVAPHVGLVLMPHPRVEIVEDASALARSEAALGAPVLNFNQPKRFPELYVEDVWWDPGHLNAKGAAIFSKLIAGPLCDRLKAAGG